MKKNVGATDAKIRSFVLAPIFAILGVVTLVTGFGGSTLVSVLIAVVLFVFAGVMIYTARASSCPIYSAVGMSTAPADENQPVG